MPFILHIDTASHHCSVALSSEHNILAEKTETGFNIHGKKLTTFIGEVLNKARVRVEELSYISLNMGPGSFTGLRIGLSTVKGMAYALDIPVIGLDGLKILSEAVESKKHKMVISPNIRQHSFYYNTHLDEASKHGSNTNIITAIREMDMDNIVLIFDLVEMKNYSPFFDELDCERIELERTAGLQKKMAWQYAEKKCFIDPYSAEPHYTVEFVSQPKK